MNIIMQLKLVYLAEKYQVHKNNGQMSTIDNCNRI